MDEPNNRFHYTYSAPTEEERREIESIRREYQPREKKETDLERLRALDRKVKNLPMAVGLSLGVVGVLVFELMKVALQFMNVNSSYTYIVQGLVIIVAVAIDIRKYLAKK